LQTRWHTTRNRFSVKIRLAVCLFLLTNSVWAGSRNHPAKTVDTSDPGYVFALAAANHFLHDWQTGDVENGMVLLSDSLRRSRDAEQVEEFFSNTTNRAFEITRGKGHAGRYTFPIVLVTLRGSSSSRITRKFAEIVLIDTGKNDWVVDKLP
jgi:hypothetical protein